MRKRAVLNSKSPQHVSVVLICCCIRIRVPRTKQEIEADYKRKKIAIKFRKRLKIISNQDMEAVDLRKGKANNFFNTKLCLPIQDS